MADRPPLGLQVEVVYPNGSTVQWDSPGPAKNRPTGITFRTARFDGFADASLTLNRRIDLDYPDLALLGGVNFIGEDGAIAYEGRIGAAPRSLAAGQGHQISLTLQGWMSSAKDRPFVEVYVDRDLSKWTDMSRTRRLSVLASSYGKLASPTTLADTTGTPVVELGISDNWVAPYIPLAEAWWLPRPGITVGQIYYSVTSNNAAPWVATAAICANDTGGSPTVTGNLIAGASGYLTATGAAAFLQLAYPNTPSGTQGSFYYAHWAKLAVYGNHSVPLQGPAPGGVFASDVIKDIIARFCPKLNAALVTPTTFVIPHLSFPDETMPYDAFLAVNAFHRWGLECYENRAVRYAPVNLTDYDWEVRLADAGTSMQLQGDDMTMLANGVVVRYTDLQTARPVRLTPTGFPADLADLSIANPANAAGIQLWSRLDLSAPTTQTAALQIGRAYLAEFNKAQAPGSVTVTGHIRDRAGHWQQGWKVRAGDRVAITDFPNDRPRMITETRWNHDAKTLTISVESSAKRLDAVLDRINVALQAANLTLPA